MFSLQNVKNQQSGLLSAKIAWHEVAAGADEIHEGTAQCLAVTLSA